VQLADLVADRVAAQLVAPARQRAGSGSTHGAQPSISGSGAPASGGWRLSEPSPQSRRVSDASCTFAGRIWTSGGAQDRRP
jgi:hypothetical protein